MVTPNPQTNPTIEVTRHEKEGWREEQFWNIVPSWPTDEKEFSTPTSFKVIGMWEAIIDDSCIPDLRDRWIVLEGSASECRMFLGANKITCLLDWSLGFV